MQINPVIHDNNEWFDPSRGWVSSLPVNYSDNVWYLLPMAAINNHSHESKLPITAVKGYYLSKPWSNTPLQSPLKYYYLNQYPSDEFDFIKHWQAPIHQADKGCPSLNRSLPAAWKETDALLIIRHGSTDPNDIKWLPATLPPTVWLLICDEGQSQTIAEESLKRGARTVIFAKGGKLVANEISNLVLAIMNTPSHDPANHLPQNLLMRYQCHLPISAQLVMLGEFNPDPSPAHAINRATFSKQQVDHDLLYENYQNSNKYWWLSSHSYHLCELLKVCESRNHNLMQTLRNGVHHDTASAELTRAYAKTLRRNGDYTRAMELLGEVWDRTDSLDPSAEYELRTLHLQIAIDLALPEIAKALIEQAHPQMVKPEHQEEEKLKQLDWQYRIHMRQGKWYNADQFMAIKEQRVKEEGGLRERINRLLGAAWAHMVEDQDQVKHHSGHQEMAAVIREFVINNKPCITKGNDTILYAERALALWDHACGREIDIDRLENRSRQAAHPAPVAQAILFAKEDPIALHHLSSEAYWLEILVISWWRNPQNSLWHDAWKQLCDHRNAVINVFSNPDKRNHYRDILNKQWHMLNTPPADSMQRIKQLWKSGLIIL